jgi:hypothetical protein
VLLALPAAGSATAAESGQAAPRGKETALDARRFRVIDSESGPTNYYEVVDDPSGAFIRAEYWPPLETVTLGIEMPERLKKGVKKIRWRWRAQVLPKGGNDCRDGRADSAAAVYVTFKRGLKWYSLKYVWAGEGARGKFCQQKRNPFVAQDAIVLEAGGPTNEWRIEEIDPSADFRRHFENGDPNADVPELQGVGIMTDGDQTASISAADFGGFTLVE